MKANDIQHGGTHYKDLVYQPWDFICDTGMHFLLGSFVKYITRWRFKNGIEDLKKAIHFLVKVKERGVKMPKSGFFHRIYCWCTGRPLIEVVNAYYVQKFTNQLSVQDGVLIRKICFEANEFYIEETITMIEGLIKQYEGRL